MDVHQPHLGLLQPSDAVSASGSILQFQQQQTPWYAEVAENASHSGNAYRTEVSGAGGLALITGTVLPPGAAPRSVTLNGQPVPYQRVLSHRGLEIRVSVPHPAAQETLAVQAAG